MYGLNDNQKIGITVIIVGIGLFLLGVLLFFDRALLVMGNLCFLLGLYFLVGITRTVQFFTKKGKTQGSLVFFGGLFVIVIGFAFIGFCLQGYGIFLLFKRFFPYVYDRITQIPVVGKYFNSPSLRSKIDEISASSD